jgi:crossover junction endodeoxyribonuclease RuvC
MGRGSATLLALPLFLSAHLALRLRLFCAKIDRGVDFMRILGIDPGVATIGFGVLDADRGRNTLLKCGVITTPAHTCLSSRLEQIFHDMQDLLAIFKPEAVSVEELFFNTNITTGIAVAHARGVILLACRLAGVPIFEYTPLQVKQSVVGYGRAEKRQVMDMVKRLCNLPAPPKPDDAADAVALALCHARSSTSLLNRGGDSPCSTT